MITKEPKLTNKLGGFPVRVVTGFLCLLVILQVIGCQRHSLGNAERTADEVNKSIDHFPGKGRIALIADDYVQWVKKPENGLCLQQKVEDISFILQYEPLEYVALRNLKAEKVTKSLLESEKKQISGFQYYTLTIETDKGTDILKYGTNSPYDLSQRIDYYSFRMQNDLKLVEDKDTLPCIMFHFERTYGIAPYSNFVLAFELSASEKACLDRGIKYVYKDKQFIFNDQILKKGIVKLKLKHADLDQLPIIKTNS
jgi:hypothetical protein